MISVRNSYLSYLGVSACFLLSGFAALLYQTAWMRQFSTVFGTSELAIATVLSAYMGGLALGAALAGKFITRVNRPVLTYGILEAAIAGSALMVPVLMGLANWAYAAVLGGQPEPPDASGFNQSFFYLAVAFVVLAIPTTCMGATLPLLTRHAVTNDREIGTRVGALYAINTAGAVAGTLAAAFVFLPALGLKGTVYVGVVVNLLVFVLAAYIANWTTSKQPTDDQESTEPEPASRSEFVSGWVSPRLILPVMLLSGTTSFVYEVLWTRLLSHIIGGSVAAFATMLASFLSGIALGSLIASRVATTRPNAVSVFVICQLGIAVTSVLIYYSLNQFLPDEIGYATSVMTSFAVLMPATLCIGATFPMAVRIFAAEPQAAASSSAKVYAWNTVGAIAGATIAAFFLLPWLKYEGTIRTMVLINAGLAVVVTLGLGRRRSPLSVASLVVLVLLAFSYYPNQPQRILQFSPIGPRATDDIIYYDVGRSATVLLYREDGAFNLRNNGLPEAAALPLGTPSVFNNQRLLGALPVLARPDARNALIVGLGTGSAVTGVPRTVAQIDVIELEPSVIDANVSISEWRKYQPLSDPRVSIIVNDARSALALTDKRYDIVVSQPSHPWSAGASHLYTREYMRLVAEHLTEDGVFLQWINTQFLDEALLKSLCATILDVYPHVRVYQWSPQVIFFLAAQQPLDVEKDILTTGRPFRDDPLFYLELGVAAVEDVIASLMMDAEGVRKFASGSAVITDDFNLMAMQSAQLLRQGRELDVEKLAETFRPWVPALNANNWVHQEFGNTLRFGRIAERFVTLSLRQYLPDVIAALSQSNNAQAELLAAQLLREQGGRERSDELLAEAVRSMPQSNEARYVLVSPWIRSPGFFDSQAGAEIPEQVRQAAIGMTGRARAVVEASQAMARRDLQSVADLDAALAASGPGDPWYAEAVKLRVDWRNSVSDPGLREQFADQAWQILDLAMANKTDHEFLAMRVASAGQAGRVNELIESTRAYIRAMNFQFDAVDDGYFSPSSAELAARLRQINAILRLNEQVTQDTDSKVQDSSGIQTRLKTLVERANTLINQ
jgi:spermidine synthase